MSAYPHAGAQTGQKIIFSQIAPQNRFIFCDFYHFFAILYRKINTIKENAMALFDEVKEVVVEQLNVSPDEVKEESKFVEDLGADSLDVVELVMALEEKFDIEIPDDQAEKIATVADAIKFITENK
jgi:acyl carrier protein